MDLLDRWRTRASGERRSQARTPAELATFAAFDALRRRGALPAVEATLAALATALHGGIHDGLEAARGDPLLARGPAPGAPARSADAGAAVVLPAPAPGERIQLWSDAPPHDDRPWCWSLHAPGRAPATGAAGTMEEAVAALAAALEAVRRGGTP